MIPSELPPHEEAHYYHTIQYFNALVKTHGAKQVLEDLKSLDLLTYETIVVQLIESSQKSKPAVAAIFRNTWC